jgi:hypothetical protein
VTILRHEYDLYTNMGAKCDITVIGALPQDMSDVGGMWDNNGQGSVLLTDSGAVVAAAATHRGTATTIAHHIRPEGQSSFAEVVVMEGSETEGLQTLFEKLKLKTKGKIDTVKRDGRKWDIKTTEGQQWEMFVHEYLGNITGSIREKPTEKMIKAGSETDFPVKVSEEDDKLIFLVDDQDVAYYHAVRFNYSGDERVFYVDGKEPDKQKIDATVRVLQELGVAADKINVNPFRFNVKAW